MACAQDGVTATSNATGDDCCNPIAICGMALRLPGGISNPSEFWNFLMAKKDAISRVPHTRYNISSYYSETDSYSSAKTEYGYFLDETVDLGALDTSFFSFTKLELEYIDPQQRQLLELVRECFESAGEVNYRGKDIGCYVGSFGDDWFENLFHDLQMYGKYPLTIGMDFSLPNRLSFEYDLRGPSMSIRTACSSSLVCLHDACRAIQNAECSSAIVAGCNLIMSPTITLIMSAKGVLSPDGSCKSFDASANGYGRGEAINVVYIKPLKDALRDGNPVRAIIRGTATNSDGKSAGFTVPSATAQEKLIRKAYHDAGIDCLSKTPLVECHGTGTAAGDPAEAKGILNAFGTTSLYLTSVKPNVGHSEGASGLTSLIKVVLALEHEVIPPNIKFTVPNPNIPFQASNLKVPTDAVPWPHDRFVRASVNCFGMGGTNAHAIIDSARYYTSAGPVQNDSVNSAPHLLVFSANSSHSLGLLVKKTLRYYQDNPTTLVDLAYTLGARREHLPFRAASIVHNGTPIKSSSIQKMPSLPPVLVMVFTGQGAQWPGMGRRLYEVNCTFRTSLLELNNILRELPEAPDWSIVDEMEKDKEQSNLHKASYAQPICTAIQIALIDTLRKLSITPWAVLGHSSGEIAAAYAAGRLSAREALCSAFYRGLVSGQATKRGSMAAVGMGSVAANQFLVPGVVIACENSASSITLSGDVEELEKVLRHISCSRPEVLIKRIDVGVAYHSHHMEEVGDRYHSLLDPLVSGDPCMEQHPVHFFSSVTGELLEESHSFDARYWQLNLESPVAFHAALKNLMAHTDRQLVFLEVGPHSALASSIRETIDLTSRQDYYVPCLSRSKDCSESFLDAIGYLYCRNITVDFNTLTNTSGTCRVLTDLPTYCWDHSYSSLYEPRQNKDWRWCKHGKHELLGIRVVDSTEGEPSWRNVLHLEHVPWLRDHKVWGTAIFPAAGYIAMIGAALAQVVGSPSTEYRVRNVVFSAALVLNDLKSTEILTSLRKRSMGEWFDFVISSHNGVTWTEHCHGQSRPGAETAAADDDPDRIKELPRSVHTQSWYTTLKGKGLEYGAAFQCVHQLSCSCDNQAAYAKIRSTIKEVTHYPLHPTRIDGFFQTALAALHKGLDWNVKFPHIPVRITEIVIRECVSDMLVETSVSMSAGDRVLAEGKAVGVDGTIVITLEGAELRPVRSNQNPNTEAKIENAATLCWQPDIQFQSLATLIKAPANWPVQAELLNSLTCLCIKQALSRLRAQELSSKVPYIRKYQDWLERQDFPEIDSSLESVMEEVLTTQAAPCAMAMMKVLQNIEALCRGQVNPLEVLMSDDTLVQVYDFLNRSDRSALFRSLGHKWPKQRILEIGAGTGGTTMKLLQHTSYSTYTFTDISSAFFPAAKKRSKGYKNLVFKTLDITKEPSDQGFALASFDLIVAANVLHATPNLHQTLCNVRKLLHPRGKLYLEELCTDIKFANFVTGILPDWWAGEADGRCDEPYVQPQRWEQELKSAGFGGLDDLTFDAMPPHQINACMLASSVSFGSVAAKSVNLLCDSASAGVAIQFQAILRSRGYIVETKGLGDNLQEGTNVIVLVDTVRPFFHHLTAARLSEFQSFIHRLQQLRCGALWVTRSSQLNCNDPNFSLTVGATRTARSEFGLDLATCEVDVIKRTTVSLVVDIFENYSNNQHDEAVLRELEFAICDETVYISRILPTALHEELDVLGRQDLEAKNPIISLDIGTHGLLETLHWKACPRPLAIQHGQVEVDVDTTGVNFKDILLALRAIETTDCRLGLEASGVVRRVGVHVESLSPGDRVFLICPGSFATSVVVQSDMCVRIPNDLLLEDAATMPLVFSTAIYSLLDLGQLKKSQTVLIHSACGGVGIAAIQISQMVGATIYATVGSEEKVEYLTKTYGIPTNRIFSSRNSSFLPQVLAETRGRGVDIVLNTLSAGLFHASCRCVAHGGKFVNLTKRGLVDGGQLPFDALPPNVSYSDVELTDLVAAEPRQGRRLLQTIVKLFENGHITPIHPAQTFRAEAIEDCFRSMQSGQHIGKFRVSLNRHEKVSVAYFPPKRLVFQKTASYLLVGGMGGLGGGLARWMAEHDAKHFTFLSRHAGDSESDRQLICELESQRCTVTVIKGSVSNLADVKKAVSSTTSPIRGVFNMSMVLKDESLLRMSLEDWKAATEPKVQGSWNLHHATLDQSLDFFVLFSSLCGVIGMPGQANYAASNTFMDAFVQYRHHQHLPASVLDLGAIDGIGHVSKNPQILQRSQWLDHARMSQSELFDAVICAISYGCPWQQERSNLSYLNSAQIMTGFSNSTNSLDSFDVSAHFSDNRLSAYTLYESEKSHHDQSTPTNRLTEIVASAAVDHTILTESITKNIVAVEIAKWVFDILMKSVEDESEIDVERSLSDVGLDSLAAVEMRSWWKRTFGLDISVLEIVSFPSFAALGEHAIQGLTHKFQPAENGVVSGLFD